MREFLVAFLNERETFEKYIWLFAIIGFYFLVAVVCVIGLVVIEWV